MAQIRKSVTLLSGLFRDLYAFTSRLTSFAPYRHVSRHNAYELFALLGAIRGMYQTSRMAEKWSYKKEGKGDSVDLPIHLTPEDFLIIRPARALS